ncbi:parallel beta-helix repeat-containing protein, partial [Candidatus Magnetomorum sp. HK-1]
VAGGTIEINEGGDSNNKAVYAGGTGNILLEAMSNDIYINDSAQVLSDSGHITIVAANDINQLSNANILATNGSIDLNALAGSITINDNALINTETDNIRLLAEGDIKLGGLKADTGNVSISTLNGTILDNGDLYIDIEANSLQMSAQNGIGQKENNVDAIETSIFYLSAYVGNGGIHILEEDDITIDTVSVPIHKVMNNSETDYISDTGQSDLVVSTNGSIHLETQQGAITIKDGNNSNNLGIITDGNGNVILKTNAQDSTRRIKAIEDANIILNAGVEMNQGDALFASQGDLIVNSEIQTNSGDINLISDKNIFQNANIYVSEGQIQVSSLKGTIEMTNGSMTSVGGSGSIIYSAKKDIAISVLNANQEIQVNSISGEISDHLVEETANIISQQITMTAALGIGATDDINTNARNFDVQNSGETGDIYISDIGLADDIEIKQLAQNNHDSDGDIIFNSLKRSVKLIQEGKGASTQGTGDITFSLQGKDADMIVDAAIKTETGNLHIEVENNLEINVPYETSGEVTMNIGNNYGNTSGNMYRTNSDGVTTFMWQAVPDINIYTIKVKKDGIIHYRDLVCNETKWTPKLNLDWEKYQLTAEPTIKYFRTTKDIFTGFDKTVHVHSNYLNQLDETELLSDPITLFIQDSTKEFCNLDDLVINWGLFEKDYPQASYQIDEMNQKTKWKVGEDSYLTTNKGVTYKLDPELAGAYVEIKYSSDRQQLYVVGPDGFIYGPYAEVKTETTPLHQENETDSSRFLEKDFWYSSHENNNPKESHGYKFLEKDFLNTTRQENKSKKSENFLEKDFLYPIHDKTILFTTIEFEQAKLHISPEDRDILQKIARTMSKNNKCILYIDGHAWQKASSESSNIMDSLKSGKKIRHYLINHYNIDPTSIRIFSYGSKHLQFDMQTVQANRSFVNVSLVELEN